jgi:hypothetical protein
MKRQYGAGRYVMGLFRRLKGLPLAVGALLVAASCHPKTAARADVRAVKNKSDLQAFLDSHIRPEKQSLSDRFELAMLQLREDSIQKYRLKYVLAKLTQWMNEAAWGSGTEGNLNIFLDGTVHVEHILPQRPSIAVLSEFDLPEEADAFIGRLGNLTLAEEPINCSLGNKPFSKKRPFYKNSKFLLTQLLSGTISVGKNTAVERAISRFPIFDKWCSNSIEDRQIALAKLARQVWSMPEPKASQPETRRCPDFRWRLSDGSLTRFG